MSHAVHFSLTQWMLQLNIFSTLCVALFRSVPGGSQLYIMGLNTQLNSRTTGDRRGWVQALKRDNSKQQITEASIHVVRESSNCCVSELVQSVVMLNSRLHVRQ
jgi:hypothetical protein